MDAITTTPPSACSSESKVHVLSKLATVNRMHDNNRWRLHPPTLHYRGVSKFTCTTVTELESLPEIKASPEHKQHNNTSKSYYTKANSKKKQQHV